MREAQATLPAIFMIHGGISRAARLMWFRRKNTLNGFGAGKVKSLVLIRNSPLSPIQNANSPVMAFWAAHIVALRFCTPYISQ